MQVIECEMRLDIKGNTKETVGAVLNNIHGRNYKWKGDRNLKTDSRNDNVMINQFFAYLTTTFQQQPICCTWNDSMVCG